MGRGGGDNLTNVGVFDPLAILYGRVSPPRLHSRPNLELFVPSTSPFLDRDQLRDVIQALSLMTLVPKSPKKAEPLYYLHRRIRHKIEKLAERQPDEELQAEDEISFSSTQMACLDLPKGSLSAFKLRWNEWDMVLAALTHADAVNREAASSAYKRDRAQLTGSFIDIYTLLCASDSTQKSAERNGRVSCVRCGDALELDKAAVDPKAYRCRGCPAVE